MNEIYWITRLDDISFFLGSISIISGILFVLAAFVITVASNEGDLSIVKGGITSIKISLSAFLLSMTINVFVPTTKDAMLIFGVGGTIDYIKSNETINKLPDKCVKALEAWVESLTEKESKNEN